MDILSEKSVDVVITDIVMPGASGMELLEKVKENYHADVMVMTGFTEDYNYEEIIKMGASDFIQKPLNLRGLVVRLKRVLLEQSLIAERNNAEEKLKQSYCHC